MVRVPEVKKRAEINIQTNVKILIKALVVVWFLACIIYVIYLCSLWTRSESLENQTSKPKAKSKNANLIECYKLGRPVPPDGIRLFDVLESDRKPRPGKSIFFHETSCPESGFMILGPRQVCSIESAAKHNPNMDIFVLFTSPRYILRDKVSKDLMRLLVSYDNIFLRNNDMWKYSENSSAAQFLETEQIFESSYFPVHLSDFLRLLSIWKFGGIYMDSDVIVKRTFENLPLNYGGLEEHSARLNNGLIGLDSKGFGPLIGQMFIDDFTKNYNAGGWASNGPELITRVLIKVCNATDLKGIAPEKCKGFKVHPRSMFWAVSWVDANDFFNPDKLTDLETITNNSYSIHVFNHLTKDIMHKVGTNSLYGLMAREHCPLTYNNVGDFL
ncbi:hypothetical protein ACFFRR_002072 [Megaselia abdita]